MAYYDALKTQWATLTPGTTQAKLDQLNAQTVTGAVPAVFSVTGAQIYNCLNPAEFEALNVTNQQFVRDIFGLSGQIAAGTGTTVQTVLLALFGPATVTRVSLIALAQGITQPWWQSAGYAAPMNIYDVTAAGLS